MEDFDKIELTEEVKTLLYQKQEEIVKILEAIDRLEKNKDWQTIKDLVFGTWLKAVERQIYNESLSKEIDTSKLYKLQGEWASAKQYSDPVRFAEALKVQLEAIKKKLK